MITLTKDNSNVEFLVERIPSRKEEIEKAASLVEAALNILQYKLDKFTRLISGFKFIFTYEIPTMCVGERKAVYMNPAFTIRELKKDSNVAIVLFHEMLHVLFAHIKREDPMYKVLNINKNQKTHRIFNIAADYEVNNAIVNSKYTSEKNLRDNLHGYVDLEKYSSKPFEAIAKSEFQDRIMRMEYEKIVKRYQKMIEAIKKDKSITLEERKKKAKKLLTDEIKRIYGAGAVEESLLTFYQFINESEEDDVKADKEVSAIKDVLKSIDDWNDDEESDDGDDGGDSGDSDDDSAEPEDKDKGEEGEEGGEEEGEEEGEEGGKKSKSKSKDGKESSGSEGDEDGDGMPGTDPSTELDDKDFSGGEEDSKDGKSGKDGKDGESDKSKDGESGESEKDGESGDVESGEGDTESSEGEESSEDGEGGSSGGSSGKDSEEGEESSEGNSTGSGSGEGNEGEESSETGSGESSENGEGDKDEESNDGELDGSGGSGGIGEAGEDEDPEMTDSIFNKVTIESEDDILKAVGKDIPDSLKELLSKSEVLNVDIDDLNELDNREEPQDTNFANSVSLKSKVSTERIQNRLKKIITYQTVNRRQSLYKTKVIFPRKSLIYNADKYILPSRKYSSQNTLATCTANIYVDFSGSIFGNQDQYMAIIGALMPILQVLNIKTYRSYAFGGTNKVYPLKLEDIPEFKTNASLEKAGIASMILNTELLGPCVRQSTNDILELKDKKVNSSSANSPIVMINILVGDGEWADMMRTSKVDKDLEEYKAVSNTNFVDCTIALVTVQSDYKIKDFTSPRGYLLTENVIKILV